MATSEVLVPMGSLAASALTDMPEGRLFVWSGTEKFVRLTNSKTCRPVGITLATISQDELLNRSGHRSEWFLKSGVVKVPLDFDHSAGDQLQPGSGGTIDAYTDGTVFGVVLTDGDAGDYADVFCYGA